MAIGARLLLVIEDALLAEVTGFRLELLGFQVETVDSAEKAWTAMESGLPDAIIVDLHLPGVSGLEFVNRLSNDPRTHPIPILVLSTSGDLDEVHRAHAAGAKQYIVVPYDPSVLEQKLERMLEAAVA